MISVYSADRDSAEVAISDAFAEVRRLDGVLSLHRAESELVRVNRDAAGGPVTVSEDLFAVLEKAQEIATLSEGSFDVTIRPLADLWGFIWKEYRLPTEAELRSVLPRVNYKLVRLDPVRRTVQFLAPVAPDVRRGTHPTSPRSPSLRRGLPTTGNAVSLDLGGIAKGYIVDRALGILHARGFTNAMVRAGGDLRVSGPPPGRSHWEVQLEDPRKQGRRTTIPLRDAAVSTSGDYENFFTVGGKRYSHILNPKTGLPVEGVASCSVITATCMESDALATAFFVLGPERTAAGFTKYPARFVLSDGHVFRTAGFP